jgi:purine nucleosidase
LALTDPDLFETTSLAGDVEVTGELTAGATIFDRRGQPQWRDNMEVVTALNADGVTDRILDLALGKY